MDRNSQTINCDVCSCAYNEQGKRCGLKTIQVCACCGGSAGTPEDESMCGSYRSK